MGMSKEDVIRAYGGLHELRTKEMTAALSPAERKKLNDLLDEIEREDEPTVKEAQEINVTSLYGVKDLTFIDVTSKQGWLDRLRGKEQEKFYELASDCEHEDVEVDGWTISFATEMRMLMEDAGIGYDWPKMLPVLSDAIPWRALDEEQVEQMKKFPSPDWCYMKLQEAQNLDELAAARGEDFTYSVDWLKKCWGNGYYVYADIEELFYF